MRARARSGAPGAGRRAARPLVLLAAIVWACSSRSEAIHVREVRLVTGPAFSGFAETGIDGPAVEDAVRTALAGAGFRMGPGSRPHIAGADVPSLRIVPGLGGPRAEVSVEVILAPATAASTPPRREVGTAAVAFSDAAGPRDTWRRALADAAQRAAEGLAIGVRAEDKRVGGLVADLASKDARVREQAIRVLGERHAREAVPALVAELDREDARLAHRIVGALAQIGDDRAVPALIDLARGADPTLTSRLVRFIGDIGGPEAEGYLLTVASGHPDERVRQAAREALDDLAARAKDAPVAARK